VPYRITQCYLPPGSGDIPAFIPAEAGTRFSDPGGMQGWVDLVGCWWYTRPKTVSHPSTNWAQCAVTSFMRRTTLATTTSRQRNVSEYHNHMSLMKWHLIMRKEYSDRVENLGRPAESGMRRVSSLVQRLHWDISWASEPCSSCHRGSPRRRGYCASTSLSVREWPDDVAHSPRPTAPNSFTHRVKLNTVGINYC